ncbi:MAG: hypothetical protein IT328_01610 [Caldilineaceae bacterium]|nr:hypothetical protein [Caldilineaceae bacterium]
MGNIKVSVVLVSEPSIHKTSLLAVLCSAPALQLVGIAGGCLSALHLVQKLHPDFVLIAADFPEAEVITFMQSARSAAPQTRVIVLRKAPWRRSLLLDAGASAVLSQDSSVSALLAEMHGETP